MINAFGVAFQGGIDLNKIFVQCFSTIFLHCCSEAKLAMMNLNHTEPLKLHINVAYKVLYLK